MLLEALTTAAGLGVLYTCGELAAPRVWTGLLRVAERWHTPRPKCTYPEPRRTAYGEDLSGLDESVARRLARSDRCPHGVLWVNFPGGVCDCYGSAGVGDNGGTGSVVTQEIHNGEVYTRDPYGLHWTGRAAVPPKGPPPKSSLE